MYNIHEHIKSKTGFIYKHKLSLFSIYIKLLRSFSFYGSSLEFYEAQKFLNIQNKFCHLRNLLNCICK